MGDKPELLLVDDEELIRLALGRKLREAGFDVTVLPSGHEATKLLEKKPFDAVVTDIVMEDIDRPIVDGIAVLEEARKANPAAVVIILTGHASLGSVLEARRKGAFDYFVKPCDNTLLIKTIRDGLVMAQRNQAFHEAMSLADAVIEARDLFINSSVSAVRKTTGYGQGHTPNARAYLDWLLEPLDHRERRFALLTTILQRAHVLSERMNKIGESTSQARGPEEVE